MGRRITATLEAQAHQAGLGSITKSHLDTRTAEVVATPTQAMAHSWRHWLPMPTGAPADALHPPSRVLSI